MKVNAHLLSEGGQPLYQFNEDPESQGKTAGEGLELEDLISPCEMRTLLVSVVDQNMEASIFEANRGGPVTWSDRGCDGQRSLHLEPDLLLIAI